MAKARRRSRRSTRASTRAARPASPPRQFHVYVIELSRDCTATPCAYAPVYVGQTAHTPEERFDQHKAGGRLASGKPHRYGVRLRYDLMQGWGPYGTRADAEAAEQALAEALEARGHLVFWN